MAINSHSKSNESIASAKRCPICWVSGRFIQFTFWWRNIQFPPESPMSTDTRPSTSCHNQPANQRFFDRREKSLPPKSRKSGTFDSYPFPWRVANEKKSLRFTSSSRFCPRSSQLRSTPSPLPIRFQIYKPQHIGEEADKSRAKVCSTKVCCERTKRLRLVFWCRRKMNLKLGGTGCSALAVAVVLKAADGTTFISHPCLLHKTPKSSSMQKTKTLNSIIKEIGDHGSRTRKDLVTPCCII